MLFAMPDKEDTHFYRNAQGDEVVYVRRARARSRRSSATSPSFKATTW